MAEQVLGLGKSGSGKSRSICFFGEREVLIYQCEKKRLPTSKKFEYMVTWDINKSVADNLKIMRSALRRAAELGLKAVVIDDLTYVMTNMFMASHRDKSGSKSFDLYDDIADTIWSIFRYIKDSLPDDMIVYTLMHEDTNDMGETKLKTIGKLLDNKVCLEGMVTICLRYVSFMGNHVVRTHTDGTDIVKSPEGMFAADEIPNDLKAIDTAIRAYYGMEPIAEANTTAKADKKEAV